MPRGPSTGCAAKRPAVRAFLSIASVLLLSACATPGGQLEAERTSLAERFFRGVYGCNPSVVDELAGDDIVVSYPIFEQLYDRSAFRGREAVREFAEGFCSRWKDAEFTFHEAIRQGDRVVLVWSFRAHFMGSATDDRGEQPPADQEHSWGGISLFRFNEAGEIVAEVGEESAPGPVERLASGK